MKTSEKLDELLKALASAREEFVQINKRTKGYNYKYADLAEVMEAVGEPLNKNGLTIFHQPDWEANPPMNVTTLMHTSGQFMTCNIKLDYKATEKTNLMQAMGGSLTYARRYALYQLLNLVCEDDDGASSGPKGGKEVLEEKEERKNTINPYQAADLEKRLMRFNKLEKVLNHYRISRLSDLPIDAYSVVLKSIKDAETIKQEIEA